MWNTRCVLTWLVGLALAFPTSPASAGDAVPVLIWGGEPSGRPSSSVNPLQKTSQSEFEKIVTEKVGGSQRPILVFVRENLCVEDFTQHREGLMHLKDDGTLIYLPAVHSPLTIFERLASYNQSLEEELETVSDGQVVITKATDLDAVSETFNMVKESSPNLIAALIGRSCAYSRSERVRRAVKVTVVGSEKPDDPIPVIKTDRFLIYWAKPPVLNVTESSSETKTEVSMSDYVGVTQEGNGTSASPLQLNFEFTVKNGTTPYNAIVNLAFVNKTGYYIASASYHEKERNYDLLTYSYFTFRYNVSYHCSANVRFYQTVNWKKSLPGIDFVMSDFQLQIDPKHSNFSYAFDCVGFTSAPIWSGLFVTLILGLIMIWGLIMIMDIRTMDRFDDPKGKTITVTASE